jgi:hypothetical protein
MISSAGSRSVAGTQKHPRLGTMRGGSALARLGAVFLLTLVLFVAPCAGIAGARDTGGAATAESAEDAGAKAVADAARAPLNGDRFTLEEVSRLLAALGEHNRDALQEMELRLRQSAADHGGPILERWILASRDEAIREGVLPIPPEMKAMLLGFFPESLLDRARYRIGWGSKASLQGYVFGVGDTKGITLGEVIVFRDAETATDPLIWAHELAHVQQYERWGTREFAARYIRSFGEVEEEAWRVHGRYKSWAQRNGLMAQTDPATMWQR